MFSTSLCVVYVMCWYVYIYVFPVKNKKLESANRNARCMAGEHNAHWSLMTAPNDYIGNLSWTLTVTDRRSISLCCHSSHNLQRKWSKHKILLYMFTRKIHEARQGPCMQTYRFWRQSTSKHLQKCWLTLNRTYRVNISVYYNRFISVAAIHPHVK